MSAHGNRPEASFAYVSGLDGLRLFAVAIVVIRHYEIITLLPGGFGVSIFFLISGFLITRLLLAEEEKTGRINLGKFYIRRLIRLLPPLLLMGIVAVPALYWVDPVGFSGIQVVMSFLYLGNLVKFGSQMFGWPEGYKALEPLWSLAVEEHFYLLLPPVLLILRSARARVRLMAVAIVGPLLLRMVVAWIDPADADQINYHFTFTRLDAMAWGVLLTLLLNDGRLGVAAINRHATLLVCGGAAAMLASMVHWTTYYEEVVKYTPQSLAIAIFFAGFILSDRYEFARKILEYEPVRHLGKISYEIYLWHFPTLTVLSYFIGNRIVALCAAIVCTIAIADLAYRLTTARLAPLRRKFGGHPANPVTGDNLRHPGTFS